MIRQVFKNEIMSKTAGFKWQKFFKDGRESVEDELRAGRPSTPRTDGTVQHVREVLARSFMKSEEKTEPGEASHGWKLEIASRQCIQAHLHQGLRLPSDK